MRLADFEGTWIVERTIADARTGQRGRFEGIARFVPDGAGLSYREEGRLALGDAAPLAASRSYLWRENTAGEIEVHFPDGRFFHRFEPDAPAPADTHDCAPDRYRVRYDFAGWPRWTAVWRVTGPRKDYEMVTRFRPAGASR